MADLPLEFGPGILTERLARVLDVEGKIPRALGALGPLGGRDVVLLDGAGGLRARQLLELGARLIVLERADRLVALRTALDDVAGSLSTGEGNAAAIPLGPSSVDAVVAYWSAYRGPSPAQVAEADRVLRPGGRLLIVHDYGRDDVEALWPAAQAERLAWSRRDGWFLRSGFRIRVLHCWWTFQDIEAARAFLRGAFGEAGERLAAGLRRPRLSYNVAVYHRDRGAGQLASPIGAGPAVAE